MNTCIITGATSMLGLATLKECIRNNVRVVALSRAGSHRKICLPKSDLVSFIECDLSALNEIAVPRGTYDVFYHFGWGYTDRNNRNNPILQNKNISYTLDAVELAHRAGCKKFVGAGSQAEYGFKDDVITEDTFISPETCYGIAKYAAGRLAEELCKQYGMLCIWTRTFSVFGINDGANAMIPYALGQFIKGEKAYFSEGTQMWDYLYEDDAGQYFYLLGDKMNESGVIHVASGDHRLLKSYIMEMADVLNATDGNGMFQYELTASVGRKPKGIQPDVSKLRRITGYMPKVSFKEGIGKINDAMCNSSSGQ